jgi:hypothetical protein
VVLTALPTIAIEDHSLVRVREKDAKQSLVKSTTCPKFDPSALKSTRLPQNRPPPKKTLPLRQQLPLSPPPRVLISDRSRRLYPRMSVQTGLRPPPRRRRNNRLRGVPRRPRRPRGQIQAQAQALAQPITPARVAGPGSPNGAIEAQLESYYSANGA